MKFYELKQQASSGHWHHLGFFRKKSHAEEHSKQFNTGVEVAPLKIEEHEFKKPEK